MTDVVIVAAARTAIGRAPRGALRNTRPDDLAAVAITAVLDRTGGAVAPSEIDDVVFGCAMPEAEQGMDIARIAALRAGLPESVPGVTVTRFCASGLEAIASAAAKIATGQADIILAGGAESMSMVEFMGPTTRPNPYLVEHCPDTYLGMGLSTEGLAAEFGITRLAADEAALASHTKAIAAQDAGRFIDEIVRVVPTAPTHEGDGFTPCESIFEIDEGPRRDSTAEGLAKLRPVFRPDGIITAGNASQRSDGAAAVLLMSLKRAEAKGLVPMARFAGYTVCAVAPSRFGIAPAHAVDKLLRRHAKSMDGIDLIEFNEAFAAQMLAANQVLPLPMDRVNVNGGAVALGHPLGATGARQTVTMLYEARRRKAKFGVVTMCAALGMGAAALYEFA